MKNFILITLFFLTFPQLSIGQNTILWKVTDTVNNKSSFIVGTFHQFGNSFVDSIPEIKKSLINSEFAIFESIDDTETTRRNIERREKSPEIEKSLSKKDFQKLKEISKDWKVDLYKLKPFELNLIFQQEFQRIKCKTVLPTDKWDHFDNYLIHIAEENGIEVFGLETDSLQLNLIEKDYSSSNWRKERKIIKFWIEKLTAKELEEGDCSFTKKYRKFDLDYGFSEDCPNDILIKQRNEDWMKIIPNLVRNKNCFIAVGYRHLMNDCGLIERLRANGFLVEPIEIKPFANRVDGSARN